MKTNFLVIMAILVIAFGSCESDEFIEKERTSINLVAPNGQKIATTIEELTTLVAETVEKKYGESKDVEIDKVVYHDAEIGFIAEIKYVTYDGHSSNLIMSNAALGRGYATQTWTQKSIFSFWNIGFQRKQFT